MDDFLILWLWMWRAFFFLQLFVVAAMVGGCGGCEWIWWPAALGCERETQRRERQRERDDE